MKLSCNSSSQSVFLIIINCKIAFITKPSKPKVTLDIANNQSLSSFYLPKVGDMIIGRIVSKFAFSYELDINSYSTGVLDSLEFDGATKRNKPNLEINSLVYCRVKSINKYSKPVLSCISPMHK